MDRAHETQARAESGSRGWMTQPRAARIAVAYIFFANGAVGGNWVTRIPALKIKLDLRSASLFSRRR